MLLCRDADPLFHVHVFVSGVCLCTCGWVPGLFGCCCFFCRTHLLYIYFFLLQLITFCCSYDYSNKQLFGLRHIQYDFCLLFTNCSFIHCTQISQPVTIISDHDWIDTVSIESSAKTSSIFLTCVARNCHCVYAFAYCIT